MSKYLWPFIVGLLCYSATTLAHNYAETQLQLSVEQQLTLIGVARQLVEDDGLKPEPDPGAEFPAEGLSGLIENTFTSYDASVITQIDDKVAQSELQKAFEPLYYLGFSEHLATLAYHFDQKDDVETHTRLNADTQQALSELKQVLQQAKQGDAE